MTSAAASAPPGGRLDDDLAADLRLALRLADAADAISMPRFDAADLDVTAKPDHSFVTDADLATERAIRTLLESERPDDGVLGEEFGTAGNGRRQWLVDPIDGTHNYLRGIPMWGTLIALAIDGDPVVGVVSMPALGRRWWAARGVGAFTDGDRALRVSDVDRLDAASVSFQSLEQWDDAGHLDAVIALSRATWRDRGYGDVWPYMLLAEGRLEMVAEFDVKEYDVAAVVPIVREAGGRFTSFDGEDTIAARSSLATNGVLHDEVLALLHADRGGRS